MWKNYSNKKTWQVSEIKSKKLCSVDNNLSPNTPRIDFFNVLWRWLYSCYTLFVCEDLCFSRKSLSCMPLECDLIITGFVWVTAFPLTINSVLVPISCASSLNLLKCLLLMCPGFLRKIVPPTTNKSFN